MERMDALLYDCDIREPLFDYLGKQGCLRRKSSENRGLTS